MKTHGRFCVWLLVLVALSALRRVDAAPAVDDKAEGRVVAYQREVRVQLARGGWQIVREQPGRLVADHYLGFPLGAGTVMEDILDTNVTGVARVVVTFKPETATATSCEIKATRSDYIPNKKSEGHYTLSKPRDITAPNILEGLAGLVGRANARMVATHPEYAAK